MIPLCFASWQIEHFAHLSNSMLVWVPAVYTSLAMSLADRPVELAWPRAAGFFFT